MKVSAYVQIELTAESSKVLRALRYVVNQLESLHEDMPWRDEIVKAAKATRYVANHIDVQVAK